MESETSGLTSKFFQIFFAIVLVIIFLIIGFAVYNYEMLKSIKSRQNVQITTPIFKGIIDFKSTTADQSFNTLNNTNPLDPTYRNLGNATNQPGGAEFSYNFWLYLDPDTKADFLDPKKTKPTSETSGTFKPDYGLNTDQLILFTRGTNEAVEYDNICSKTSKKITKKDVMIKCPLVKLENAGDVLTVEFNTVQGTDAVMQNARDTCKDTSTDWNYINSYKLGIRNLKATYPAQWFMVTLVITDTYPSDPLPIRNKVRCKIYINGAIQLDTYVDGKIKPSLTDNSILKQNQGNLIVAPQPKNTSGAVLTATKEKVNKEKAVCMADLTFMNYVPTPAQLATLYSAGFTQSYAPSYTAPTSASGALANSSTSFMNRLSTNTNPDAVSKIYTQ